MRKYYDIYYKHNFIGTVIADNYSVFNDEFNEIRMVKFLDKEKQHVAIFNTYSLPEIEKCKDRFGKELFNVYID